MARRSQANELEFGSDSFLDIVANIVGILIILIVVAGVRVSQAPVPTAELASTDVVAAIPETVPAIVPVDPRELEPLLPSFADSPVDPKPPASIARASTNPRPHKTPQPVRVPVPPPDLVQEAKRIREQLTERESEAQQLASVLQSTQAGQQSLQQQRKLLAEQVEQRAAESSRAAEVISSLQEEIEAGQRQLAELRVRLAESETAGPPTQVLKHELTPVGRVVQGNELHFQLSHGRVASVPVDKLAERLKSHLERQRDRLVKVQRYVGTIGPVDGFRMEYVVEQIPTSLLEDLKYGQHVVRVGVTQWQLIPESDVLGETLEEAVNPRSDFIRQLRSAGQQGTVTFWVYPDSFDLHRGLQEFAHEQGFFVAARPLPAGVPITGSPNGSKSVAQ